MKKLFILLLLPFSMYALEMPKSSLEIVKKSVESQLEDAKKQNNQNLIMKYQSDLAILEKKIKKFELEWLKHRKNQLESKPKPVDPAIADEINEINKLIEERSNELFKKQIQNT